ncbi:putative membrane protein [Mycobacterium kansasii]|uniref:Putative membrane protein n=1 Tax=Mycobacterium kansasii TaxID=1768 RepID=A0A1V3WDV8_MYCKA|nr:putative membrane protein [Mycobacterium kansasii]
MATSTTAGTIVLASPAAVAIGIAATPAGLLLEGNDVGSLL